MAVVVAWVARPAWEILAVVFQDPLPDQGAAVFSFISDRDDVVRIVGIRLGDNIRLEESPSGPGFIVTGPSGRGTMSAAMLSERQGQQRAEIRYHLGESAEALVFRFDVRLIAQSQCDVSVRFEMDAPRASACEHHRPASYGGTWRH